MGKRVAILIGAGAECSFGMPTGPVFKRETICNKNAPTLFKHINGDTRYDLSRFHVLSHNSHGTLWQTYVESNEVELSPRIKRIINKYSEIKEGKADAKGEKEIRKNFAEWFKEDYYNPIVDEQFDPNSIAKHLKEYLEKGAFYSYIDSLFNYLRSPETYTKECSKVMKLYYNSFLSIAEKLVDDKFLDQDLGQKEYREYLLKAINDGVDARIKNNSNEDTYYSIIANAVREHKDCEFDIITTNYTSFAEKMIPELKDRISYPHGRLELFENLHTKEVKRLDEFKEGDIIFPFIFIQSGVKPIVAPYQIEQFAKAKNAIEEADTLIVLGYGINKDDDHINAMLRERISRNAKIVYLEYTGDVSKADRIVNILNVSKDKIEFLKTDNLKETLDKLVR